MENSWSEKAVDLCLLEAIVRFVSTHPDRTVARFGDSLVNWGSQWIAVESIDLPASEMLSQRSKQGHCTTDELLLIMAANRTSLHWEQAYTREDAAVGDNMLANYGYAEIIGKQGPFVSNKVRAGIAVYGPWIDYPFHRHQAEEIYVVLAGSAQFRIAGAEPVTRRAGEVIYHGPMVSHGLHTRETPLIIFYVWQGGDLREKPSFV